MKVLDLLHAFHVGQAVSTLIGGPIVLPGFGAFWTGSIKIRWFISQNEVRELGVSIIERCEAFSNFWFRLHNLCLGVRLQPLPIVRECFVWRYIQILKLVGLVDFHLIYVWTIEGDGVFLSFDITNLFI